MSEAASKLPRLLYIGDVRPAPAQGGAAFLHRLLREYPADRLCLTPSNLALPGVNHAEPLPSCGSRDFVLGVEWPLHTRLRTVYATWLALMARRRADRVMRVARRFRAGAVLSVLHGFSWLSAAEVAKRLDVPLHLIVHDDWMMTKWPMPRFMNGWAAQSMAMVYRQAVSRLCVCPAMVDAYRSRFGVDGDVLYPFRAADSLVFDQPPPRLADPGRPPVLAYAGTIYLKGYAEGIAVAAEALRPLGGRVVVYCTMPARQKRALGLDADNIEVRDFLPTSNALIAAVREEATAMLATMAFDPQLRVWMETSFPSKLTDYTAAGLPLIAWGPPYASLIRWAAQHPEAIAVVDRPERGAFSRALDRITNPTERVQMARAAIGLSRDLFSYESGLATFRRALERAHQPSLAQPAAIGS